MTKAKVTAYEKACADLQTARAAHDEAYKALNILWNSLTEVEQEMERARLLDDEDKELSERFRKGERAQSKARRARKK